MADLDAFRQEPLETSFDRFHCIALQDADTKSHSGMTGQYIRLGTCLGHGKRYRRMKHGIKGRIFLRKSTEGFKMPLRISVNAAYRFFL